MNDWTTKSWYSPASSHHSPINHSILIHRLLMMDWMNTEKGIVFLELGSITMKQSCINPYQYGWWMMNEQLKCIIVKSSDKLYSACNHRLCFTNQRFILQSSWKRHQPSINEDIDGLGPIEWLMISESWVRTWDSASPHRASPIHHARIWYHSWVVHHALTVHDTWCINNWDLMMNGWWMIDTEVVRFTIMKSSFLHQSFNTHSSITHDGWWINNEQRIVCSSSSLIHQSLTMNEELLICINHSSIIDGEWRVEIHFSNGESQNFVHQSFIIHPSSILKYWSSWITHCTHWWMNERMMNDWWTKSWYSPTSSHHSPINHSVLIHQPLMMDDEWTLKKESCF